MRYLLLILLACVLAGCFDSQVPPGVIGEIVGCIEAENSIYCITEYPVAPISVATIVDDVARHSIRFEQQIVTVTGEVTLFPSGGVLETGTDLVTFFLRDVVNTWKLETGKTYKLSLFIESIDRERHEYSIWSYPVVSSLLAEAAVPVKTIVDRSLTTTAAYEYTAVYVTGVVKTKREDSILFEPNNDDVSFVVFSRGAPDLLSGFDVGGEYTMPIFISRVYPPDASQSYHLIWCYYVKNY
jgi:hypothetical protein